LAEYSASGVKNLWQSLGQVLKTDHWRKQRIEPRVFEQRKRST